MRPRSANASRALLLLSLLRAARLPVSQTAILRPEPAPEHQGLRLLLQLPEMVPTGSRVPFGITVTNPGRRPRPLDLEANGPAYEVAILHPDGRIVHTWSGGRVEAEHSGRVLEPGAAVTYEGQWDQRDERGRPVPPARYQVRVTLRAAGPGEPWQSITSTLAIAP